MTGQVVTLQPAARLVYDGDLIEIVELDGGTVAIRNDRTRQVRVVRLVDLVAGARSPAAGGPAQVESLGVRLAGLTPEQLKTVQERAGHVRDVLAGDDQNALGDRIRVKATAIGVGLRTLERWIAAYRLGGEAALVDSRAARVGGTTVDPRWDAALRDVLARLVDASTPTRSAVIAAVERRLAEQYGLGVVAVPSRASAYRRLAELTHGTNAVSGSAKGRRSIADRPQGVYGRLRATRPGEFLVLDTQDLDVFAMEQVTCRWVRVQLTVAQDLFTRCIVGLRVTPVSTKAVDVAGVLYDAIVPRPAPSHWPDSACWPYHGVPDAVVFDESARWRGPVCAPETLVVDHGKVFLSAHVLSVCSRLGISIQPAQPHKPTDKPTVERFFKTLRERLIQHLPAYKGPDVHSRGLRMQDEAFLFVHELEDVIREWVAGVYHLAKHDGLSVPEWPHLALSPAEMFAVGVGRAGLLRIPVTPELGYDFLPVVARTIQHYGVEVNGLRYNGPGLDGYRNTTSPYGGALAGKWPIRMNPDDVRYAWFQDPADGTWHRLDWEHAPGLGLPFSDEAARHARRLAAAGAGGGDPATALAALLDRWRHGLVADRRERRIAVRQAVEYAALPTAADEPVDPIEPGVGGLIERFLPTSVVSDDDDADEVGVHEVEDFYADAFEVIE